MKWRRQGPYKYSPMVKQDSVDGRSQRPSYATNTTGRHISLPAGSEMHSMLRDPFRVFLAPTRPKMSSCLGVELQAECFGNDFDAKRGNVCWSAYDIVTK
jgi:hypothetical protein